jgi:WD40 repeat protein
MGEGMSDEDGEFAVWAARSGAQLIRIELIGNMYSCAFSPDGCHVICGGWHGAALRDAATGAEIKMFDKREVGACAYSPGGDQMATASPFHFLSKNGIITLWDMKSGKLLTEISAHQEGNIFDISFSSDGQRLVSASSDKTLKIWELKTGAHLSTLTGHSHFVFSCDFSPDGKRIVSGSFDGKLLLWDAETGKLLSVLLEKDIPIYSCSFSPDGSSLVYALGVDICLLDTRDYTLITVLKGHTGQVYHCTFSSDNSYILSGSADGTLRIWDLEIATQTRMREQALSEKAPSELEDQDFRSSISADRVSVSADKSTWGPVDCSPDGRILLEYQKRNKLYVLDSETLEKLVDLDFHYPRFIYNIYGIAFTFSPDGRRILTIRNWSWSQAGADDLEGYLGTLDLFDVRTGKALSLPRTEFSRGGFPSFLPDGESFLAAFEDKTLRLFHTDTGRTYAQFPLRGKAKDLVIKDAGQNIVVTDELGLVRLSLKNALLKPVIVTAKRSYGKGCGKEETSISATCEWCGRKFIPESRVLDTISQLTSGLRCDQSPCLVLPDEAWEEPCLLLECPLCHKPLKFNPFIADKR